MVRFLWGRVEGPGLRSGAFSQTNSLTTRHEEDLLEGPEAVPVAPEPQATNVAIAEKLAVDHSTVSRIRSGQRYPSRELMRRISESFGWQVVKQLELLPDKGRNMHYADEFEKRVCS